MTAITLPNLREAVWYLFKHFYAAVSLLQYPQRETHLDCLINLHRLEISDEVVKESADEHKEFLLVGEFSYVHVLKPFSLSLILSGALSCSLSISCMPCPSLPAISASLSHGSGNAFEWLCKNTGTGGSFSFNRKSVKPVHVKYVIRWIPIQTNPNR